MIDWDALSDAEVLEIRDAAAAVAEHRQTTLTLRENTRDLALRARELDRTRAEVEAIVADVVAEVYPEGGD